MAPAATWGATYTRPTARSRPSRAPAQPTTRNGESGNVSRPTSPVLTTVLLNKYSIGGLWNMYYMYSCLFIFVPAAGSLRGVRAFFFRYAACQWIRQTALLATCWAAEFFVFRVSRPACKRDYAAGRSEQLCRNENSAVNKVKTWASRHLYLLFDAVAPPPGQTLQIVSLEIRCCDARCDGNETNGDRCDTS